MGEHAHAIEARRSAKAAQQGRIAALTIAIVLLAHLTATAQVRQTPLRQLLHALHGPPQVTLNEAYEPKPDGPSVDHKTFDELLQRIVTKDGMVDYERLRADPTKLNEYVAQLAVVPFDKLGRDEKLALLINAYNAFTLKLILEHWPLEAITDIEKPWDKPKWNLGGHEWTLNEIEHEQIRPKFEDARIHFAVNCASIGCPPLRKHAYTAEKLEQQLQAQAMRVHQNGSRWFRYDAEANTLKLTKLYEWYGNDFEQMTGSVAQYAAQYHPPLKQALEAGESPDVSFIEYSWRLNHQPMPPTGAKSKPAE